MRFFSFIAVLLAFASAHAAQPQMPGRVFSVFDFEERRLGNAEDLPMYWDKVEGSAFPHYVNGRFSTDRASSGKYSFRFDLNGGSLLYRYPAGRIAVTPGAYYQLNVLCRTTPMPAARARLTAYFADIDGRTIEGTTRHSELYSATSEKDDWKSIGFEMPAAHEKAASLVIELGLLQPAQFASDATSKGKILEQDIRGTAWFDDLTIAQVPHLSMTTSQPGNVFRLSDSLQVHVVVNDQFTDDLAARLIVRDAEGNDVFQRSGALDMASASELGPGKKAASLDLPDLRAGWYEAVLEMSSKGHPLGSKAMHLVRLPDDAPPIAPDDRFGVIATNLPPVGWRELPDILPMIGAGRVKLALWSDSGNIGDTDSAAFDVLLERLASAGIVPTGCLLNLPPSVSRKVGGSSWSQILTAKTEDWQPPLAYLISRHANHLDRWQLGEDGTESFVKDPEMRRAFARVQGEFTTLMRAPDLAMPWPAWHDMEGELPPTIALSIPPSVLPAQLPSYVSDIRGLQPNQQLSLSLQMLERERYGREVQIRDYAQRIVYALSAGATRIDVSLPFTVSQHDSEIERQPQEMLLILRTFLTNLSGATFKGRVPLAEGVEAFLFDQAGKGVLAVWTRGDTSAKRLALNLGTRPMSVDLWGNVTPLLRTLEDRGKGEVQVNVGPTPTFLVDIDGSQAQLRASVALDRPLLESSFIPHQRRLRFTNPYRQSLSGTVKLKAPKGWTLNPPTFTFTLNPDETFERDLTIQFPYNSIGGSKTLNVEFTLDGQTQGDQFTVPIAMNLGLSDVGMESLAIRDGNDIVVQQIISNYGDRPINYNAFAIVPGQARQDRSVTNLGPGMTTTRRIRFSGVNVKAGDKIRVGMKEMEGVRVMNAEVEVQ